MRGDSSANDANYQDHNYMSGNVADDFAPKARRRRAF